MKHTCIEHGEVAFCDGCLYDAALAQIERLKAELVTTEAELAQVTAIAEVYQDEMLGDANA